MTMLLSTCQNGLTASSRWSVDSRDDPSLYFFEDEQEERILSALARAEDENSSGIGDVEHDNLVANAETFPSKTDNPFRSIPEEATKNPLHVHYVKLPEQYRVVSPPTKPGEAAVSHLSSITSPWIRQYLASCHRDALLPVPKDFLLDNFNLAQLAPVIERIGLLQLSPTTDVVVTTIDNNAKLFPIYRQALRTIVQDAPVLKDLPEYINTAAQALYLLVHQRYVMSPRGMDVIRRRLVRDPIFGKCPMLSCHGMSLLPYGDSENYGGSQSRAKRYCASCRNIFYHWDSKVDGCAFGPSFCHLFLLTCGLEVLGDWSGEIGSRLEPLMQEPRIFGFRIHPIAGLSSIGEA